MSRRPKVSVLVPTYAYGRYLPEAIESVLAQDFGDFELFISDDASKDDSAAVIRAYAARDPRVRVRIGEKNLGMVANWNLCLRESQGDYVKFLFGDDRLESPAALGRMVRMLDAEPDAVLAATARVILDEASAAVEVWDELGAAGVHRGPEVIVGCLRRDRNLVGEPSAVMFRRASAARGFDETFRQLVDQEMWFHLLTQGNLVYDPEPLCAFRQHPAQQTEVNKLDSVASAECLRIIARYFELFSASIGQKPNSLAVRRILFRHIYYSRKDSNLSPLILDAEKSLRPCIPQPWYFICWVLHRVLKPFENLRRFLRRAVEGEQVRPAPASASAARTAELASARRTTPPRTLVP